MKLKTLCVLVIGSILFWESTASAAILAEDYGSNYSGGWAHGTNGGTGFGAWDIYIDSDGEATLGIDDPVVAGITGMDTDSFFLSDTNGYVNARRSFATPLKVGDIFSLQWGNNWDTGNGWKGINLYSGDDQLLYINMGNYQTININGQPMFANYGTAAITIYFEYTSTNTLKVYGTGRDGLETYTNSITVTGAPDKVQFYAGDLSLDTTANRRPYFNNLKIEGEIPTSLTFVQGTWNPVALGDYEFVISRSGATGTNVVLSSSNTNAVTVPSGVVFPEGSNTVSFNATVVSLTSGEATLIASNEASGAWGEYTVRPVAPVLSVSGPWELLALGIPTDYTLNRQGAVGTNVVLSSSNEGVLTVTNSATFGDSSTSLVFAATAAGWGTATLTASNASSGVWATFDVTVQAPELTLLGRTELWTGGATETYTLTRKGAVGDLITLGSTNTAVMTVPLSVTFPAGTNVVTFNATVVTSGTTRLMADGGDASTSLDVTITDRPEFDAYDDSSLYSGSVWSNSPAHVSGFSDWTETLSTNLANSHRGKFIGASGVSTINEGGTAFGLYANYTGDQPDPLPEIKVSREFPSAMVSGQTFSVDVAYNWSGGAKGFKLKGDFEGTPYDRFELYSSGGDTWSYKLDGGDPVVIWSNYVSGGFAARVQATCIAPNTFTFSFRRDGDAAPVLVASVVLPGTIDQVEFYNYNGGVGDEQNFYFNRMGLTKAPVPAVQPEIGAIIAGTGGNAFSFDVPAGYDLANVYGADAVDGNGSWNWALLVLDTDYTVSGDQVTILKGAASHKVIRIELTPE